MEVLLIEDKSIIEAFIVSDRDKQQMDNSTGMWVSLPTTQELLSEELESMEFAGDSRKLIIEDIAVDIQSLETRLPELSNSGRLTDLNELNYLAVQLSEMTSEETEVFAAVVESGQHSGDLKSLINISLNLDSFYLQPAFSEAEYGDFLLDNDKNDHAQAINMLSQSDDSKLRGLVSYIEKLEGSVDIADYACAKIAGEKGIFTQQGYLTTVGAFNEIYKNVQDIPAEYRLGISEPPVKVSLGEKNEHCVNAIEKAIQDSHYADFHYDMKTAVKNVFAEFDSECVKNTLANLLQNASHDGRYSQENKAWADNIDIEPNGYIYCNAHPVLLDSFVTYSREFIERERQAEKEPPSVLGNLLEGKAKADEKPKQPPAKSKEDNIL